MAKCARLREGVMKGSDQTIDTKREGGWGSAMPGKLRVEYEGGNSILLSLVSPFPIEQPSQIRGRVHSQSFRKPCQRHRRLPPQSVPWNLHF